MGNINSKISDCQNEKVTQCTHYKKILIFTFYIIQKCHYI